MSLTVFGIVLFSAVLHAGWNALIKGAEDKLLSSVLVAAAAAVIAVVALPFLPAPAPESWLFLAISMVLQTVYYLLVAGAYTGADMTQTYPLMRGLAPILVAIFGATVLGEHPSLAGWIGVALVCGGVLSLAARPAGTGRRSILLALLNACVIAAYTLVDGTGVRASGSPASYTLWLSLLTGPPLILFAFTVRRQAVLPYVRRNLPLHFVGGAATLSAYGLALWAMTEAPVALVAALRETSILFAAAIAMMLLRERLDFRRVVAIALIAAGAIVIRLS